jgi:methionyl-tRNA formyltransferase
MGTGRFALPTLIGLCESSHEVVGLFTQPDRTGKGHHSHVNVMKEAAIARGIPVFQPQNINASEPLAQLQALGVDLAVVAAYGQILSAGVLSAPRLGCINLHASLLPKYRGAAPIQYALRMGEQETGITVFQIEPRLDAGRILGVVKTPIAETETYGELELRLRDLATPLVVKVVDQIATGTTQPVTQDVTAVTKAPRLTKSEGEIDWSKSSRLVDCHIRAMQPWPKPFTFLQMGDQKALRVLILEVDDFSDSLPNDGARAGDVFAVEGKRIVVKTGVGAVEVKSIQPAGKRAMSAAEFLNGRTITSDARFGSVSV